MHCGEPASRCPAASATATDCPTAERTAEHRTSRTSFRGHVIDRRSGRSGSRLSAGTTGPGRAQPPELTSDISEAQRVIRTERQLARPISGYPRALTGCAPPGVMVVSHSPRSVKILQVYLTGPADAKRICGLHLRVRACTVVGAPSRCAPSSLMSVRTLLYPFKIC